MIKYSELELLVILNILNILNKEISFSIWTVVDEGFFN